ncbi:1-deoxy-D-xylulose-5-phosphate synthase, partial [Streptomyces sp. SID8455]|nr:1-deoxy-D-xylulose-5-phosphate synthase [Streptomyces sp. SID8455]
NSRTGGVGSTVSQFLRDTGVSTPLREFGIPRRFLDHGARADVLAGCGLSVQNIARTVVEDISAAGDGTVNQAADDLDDAMVRLLKQASRGEIR